MSAQELESQVSMMEDALLGGKKAKTDDDDDEEEEEDEGSDNDVVILGGGSKGGNGGKNGLDDDEDDDDNNDDNEDQEGVDEEKDGGSEENPSKRNALKIPLDWWRHKSPSAKKEGNENAAGGGAADNNNDAEEELEDFGPGLLPGELIKMGSKVVAFLGLLAHAVNCGDKVLCFSQSIPTLEFLVCHALSNTPSQRISNTPVTCPPEYLHSSGTPLYRHSTTRSHLFTPSQYTSNTVAHTPFNNYSHTPLRPSHTSRHTLSTHHQEMVLGSQGWGNHLQLKSEEKGLLFR